VKRDYLTAAAAAAAVDLVEQQHRRHSKLHGFPMLRQPHPADSDSSCHP